MGFYFKFLGLAGEKIEIPWDKDIFKKHIWSELQYKMFGTKSTRELKANQINEIFDVICKHLGELGIEIMFPNEFSYYLKTI